MVPAAGGQREVVVFRGLAVDRHPMREEHALPPAVLIAKPLSSVTGPLTRKLPPDVSIASTPLPALNTIPPLISLLSAVPWPRSIVPAVAMNWYGPPSLLAVTATAPPNVTWPVVFLTTSWPNGWTWPRLALNVIVPAPVDSVRLLLSSAWLSIVAQWVNRTLPPVVVIAMPLPRVTGPLILTEGPVVSISIAMLRHAGVENDSAADLVAIEGTVAEIDRARIVLMTCTGTAVAVRGRRCPASRQVTWPEACLSR